MRQENATLRRSRDANQIKNGLFSKKIAVQTQRIKTLDGRIKELEKENSELKIRLGLEIDKVKKHVGMIFKANTRKQSSATGRGGKLGHKGAGTKRPERINKEADVYLTNCYECGTKLNPTTSVDERIVEDIPEVTTTVTLYRIQRQWCGNCHKEVRAIPQGTIPGSRFGINTLTLIRTLKYRLHTPLEKIEEILQTQYRLSITSQGIQELLHTIKTQFSKKYNDILEEIRRSPVKHADETHVRNQRGNLLTAILYEGVPLTNNHAERMIRPMVVTRKISEGSRSERGAATHAVNMSIMQTLALRGCSFLEGITKIIHAGNPRYALGKG